MTKYMAEKGWCENCSIWVENIEGEVGKLLDGAVCPNCQTPSVISGKTFRDGLELDIELNDGIIG